MTSEYKTKGTFTKSARIVSDYKNDLVFEQPRTGLIEQRLITIENLPSGMVKELPLHVHLPQMVNTMM